MDIPFKKILRFEVETWTITNIYFRSTSPFFHTKSQTFYFVFFLSTDLVTCPTLLTGFGSTTLNRFDYQVTSRYPSERQMVLLVLLRKRCLYVRDRSSSDVSSFPFQLYTYVYTHRRGSSDSGVHSSRW